MRKIALATALAINCLPAEALDLVSRPPCHQIEPAMHGPFSLEVDWSDRYGMFVDTKYAHAIGAFNALALEVGIGSGEDRLAATWGTLIRPNQMAKLTLEYFAQNPDFDFILDKKTEWVGQYDIGLGYIYIIDPEATFNDAHGSITYTNSRSRHIDTTTDGVLTYDRAISGADDFGVTMGITLTFLGYSRFTFDGHYDAVEFGNLLSKNKTLHGLGVTLAYEQSIGKQFHYKFQYTNRQPLYFWSADARWLFKTPPGYKLEIGFHTSYNSGLVPEEKENRYGAGIYYSWGGDPYYHDDWGYQAENSNGPNQMLVNWTNKPAVRPPQVLARQQEAIK